MKEVDRFLSSEVKTNYIRVRTSPGLPDSRPFMWEEYDVNPLYTYVIKLDDDRSIWNRLHRKTRVSIEKTKREGVKVEMGDYDDLRYLRTALYSRFKEQGYRPREDYYRGYLNNLYREFYPENMRIFVAKLNGERVGGLVTLCYKDWAALWIGIPKLRLSGIYPNDLVQWEAIKWACSETYRRYELMESGDDPRLIAFKSKFNPDLVPWFSAVKYSPTFFKAAERMLKFFR